jgi:hypothetical protein
MLRNHESSYESAALAPSLPVRPARLTAPLAAPLRREARESRPLSGGGVEEAIVTKGAMSEQKTRHPNSRIRSPNE